MKHAYLLFAVICSLGAAITATTSYGATRDVVFGSTLDGGTLAKYSHASNSIVLTSAGWGTFEYMINLENGDAEMVAAVSADGGSLLVLDDIGTKTHQPTTGWGDWFGLAELGSGNILHGSTNTGGSYSVQNGVSPYGYAGAGFSTLWGTIQKMTSLSNGTVASGTNNLGGSFILTSSDGSSRMQLSDNWGSFDQLVELSDGQVLTAHNSILGGSVAKFNGIDTFNSVGISNNNTWGMFEQTVAIDSGRAISGVTHLDGTFVMYDNNAMVQISTGWGTFEQMISLSNGNVVTGSTFGGGTITVLDADAVTPISQISTGQGTFFDMVELDNGEVLIADSQSGGSVVALNGTTLSVPTNGLGIGNVDQMVSIGDGEAFLFTDTGNLLRYDGSAINFISAGWGAVEQMVTVPEQTGTPGDFNGDTFVDGADFLIWQRGFGATYDADDLADWQDNYGFHGGGPLAAAKAVPEPCSAILLAMACGCLGIGGGRRVRVGSCGKPFSAFTLRGMA